MELHLIRNQLFIVAIVYLGQILVGYSFSWSAPVIPKLQDIEQTPLPNVITGQEASWIGSLLYIGAIIGPYASGFLSNRKGRKPCLFLGVSICILAYLVLALANNLAMIYTGRILIGLGGGIIFVISLVYIGEISSTHIRGVLLTSTGVFSTMGTLFIYSIGPYVPYSASAYVGLVLSLIFIVGIFFIPETPLFLVMNREEDEAKETLIYLGRANDIDKVLSTKHDEFSKQNTKKEWSEIYSVRSNRRALFITLSLNIFRQMSGIVVVVLFTTTIFELASSSIAPHIATIIIGITQLCGSTITPLFVERAGRKSLLLVSTASCCLSLAVLGTYFYLDHIGSSIVRSFGWLPLVALVLFVISYDLGFSIIPNTFIGEMFTASVRSTGSTVTITVAWLIGFFLTSSFAAMVAIGTHVPFWVYAGSCGVAFFFTLVFVPETKGKSLVEIQEMLRR